MQPSENFRLVDAVIVLANLMDADGVLNEESQLRAAKAVDVFLSNQALNLVTCGWAYRQDTHIAIADAFRTHIIANYGISRSSIITEISSRDTVGDAYFTKVNLAIPRLWKKILVVTSEYHVSRAQEIFSFVYGVNVDVRVLGAATVPTNEVVERSELTSLEAFRDTFNGVLVGNDAAILGRLRDRHPFYNGEVYATI